MAPVDPGRDLERLPGVLAATLFLDTPAGPRVYLATGPDADHEAITQAASALLTDHGYPAASGRIHIGRAPARPTPAGSLPRSTLDGLEVHRRDNRVECLVRLRTASRTTESSVTEPDSPMGRARAAARATLEAAEALDPDFRFGLQGVRALDLFGEDALVVLVDATAGRHHVGLPGTCLLDRSVEEAAALAALRALRTWSY